MLRYIRINSIIIKMRVRFLSSLRVSILVASHFKIKTLNWIRLVSPLIRIQYLLKEIKLNSISTKTHQLRLMQLLIWDLRWLMMTIYWTWIEYRLETVMAILNLKASRTFNRKARREDLKSSEHINQEKTSSVHSKPWSN